MIASPETAVVYAALILQDSGIEITSEGLTSILSAANVEVDAIWCTLFAKALSGKNLNDLLFSISAAPATSAASVASSAPVSSAPATTNSKAAPSKKEAEPESDEEMGFGLFD